MPDETTILSTKVEQGRFDLTTSRILIYQDSKLASALQGGGLLGGIIGGIAKAAAGQKAQGDGIPLAAIVSAKAEPEKKGGKGTMVLTMVSKKVVPIPGIYDVEKFVAAVNAQLAKVRAAGLTLDVRVKSLPGWQMLQNWTPAIFACPPDDVRLKIDEPGTKESAFVRTKDELGDCTVRFVYRFTAAPRFAYAAIKLRSAADGSSFGLVRLNNKGQIFAGTNTSPQAWTPNPALHTDPAQWNEALIEVTGATMTLTLNGTLASTVNGLVAPKGRVVIGAGADPKPAELAVGALTIA